ncbi:MAG TPA: transposase [Bacteroidota bacterium]|nr:transposase [Bacteroidota bacterium]
MKYNPNNHDRRSTRLKGFDYSQPGKYFVTICTFDRECLFGEIAGQEMRLNEMGKVVQEEWLKTKDVRSNVDLDKFVVMPNHIHGILIIKGVNVGATCRVAPTKNNPPHSLQSGSLGAIIGQFKSVAAKRINRIQGIGVPVWQRGFHDRIIRNEQDLNRFRKYIQDNAANWHEDEENPGTERKNKSEHRVI